MAAITFPANWRGQYFAALLYPAGSIIYYGGALWIATQDVQGTAPGTGAGWLPFFGQPVPPETVASASPPAALSTLSKYSQVTDGGASTGVSLAAGMFLGQEKVITSRGAFTHDVTIAITDPSGFTSPLTIPSGTTAEAPAFVTLVWDGGAWRIGTLGTLT